MPLAVGMLALTSGLAAACFVKAFGITFLAIPRSREAEHAHESPSSMVAGMAHPGARLRGSRTCTFRRRADARSCASRTRWPAGHPCGVYAQPVPGDPE